MYDGHASYRIVEALRNHVQHRDLAIHSISFDNGTVWTEQGPLNAFTVVPFIHVEQLRDDDAFKPSTLKEIEAKGTRFDVRGDVRIYVDCITKIRDEVIRLLKPGATIARSTYEAACRELGSHEGKELDFAALKEVDDTGIAKRVIDLATGFLTRHEEIVGRNSKLLRRKFSASFVHSAVDKLPSNEQAMMRALTQRVAAPTPSPSPPGSL